ncbi:hypothetical protein [Lacticaseibacillus hulanensis]|uniref:hypothetical protein n=1 Tax=Lacticaseibacillus hulanensis TaxID=2493111 RepID=UPI000FDC631E|nr:hypothetical protein [Lacticaseibacillus hulanensis]
MPDEKLHIMAALIDLMHSFSDNNPTTFGLEIAASINQTIGVIADPKCQGTVLYTEVLPIRSQIAGEITLDHYQLTDQQQRAWTNFKEETQHAYDDYWKAISIIRSLP